MAQSRASHFSNALIKEKMHSISGTMTGRKSCSEFHVGPNGPTFCPKRQEIKKLLKKVAFWRSDPEASGFEQTWAAAGWMFLRVIKKVWLFEMLVLLWWKERWGDCVQAAAFGRKHLPLLLLLFCLITLKWAFSFCTLTLSDVWDVNASQEPFSPKSHKFEDLCWIQILRC